MEVETRLCGWFTFALIGAACCLYLPLENIRPATSPIYLALDSKASASTLTDFPDELGNFFFFFFLELGKTNLAHKFMLSLSLLLALSISFGVDGVTLVH